MKNAAYSMHIGLTPLLCPPHESHGIRLFWMFRALLPCVSALFPIGIYGQSTKGI